MLFYPWVWEKIVVFLTWVQGTSVQHPTVGVSGSGALVVDNHTDLGDLLVDRAKIKDEAIHRDQRRTMPGGYEGKSSG